ncbi:hypothetical protein EV175_004190, partial [Coemansia sp. RSA 1933]
MSQSDWETDSDYRLFNPGMYAMRQLGRSVSKRTRKLIQPARNRQDAQSGQGDEPDAQTSDSNSPKGTGANNAAANGYLVYGFEEEASHRHGPPLPSGMHRRSLSFDNLAAIPDSIPRRSTEPAISAERNPQSMGLPEASTWNSGNTMTKTAAVAASQKSVLAASLRLGHVYDAARRQWVPEFAYGSHRPHNIDTSNDGARLSLSTRLSANWYAKTMAPPQRNSNDRHRKGSASRRARHNRESFSVPAQLDASTNFSESQTSAVNVSDPFQDHPRMWRNEEAVDAEAYREPEVLVAMAEIAAAAAANTGTAPKDTNQQVLPSLPVSSGLFRRKSARSQKPVSRESSERKVGGFARVIGNISRRLNRIRSNRSASQPATRAEIRNSILESARQNMFNAPNGYGFYRFVVDPTYPVSDSDSLEPDSPTISHHPSSARPSRLQRSTSFPSNSVGSPRHPLDVAEGNSVGQGQLINGAGPGYTISNMYNTTAVNINELGSGRTQAEFVQLERIPVSQNGTFSTVHKDTARRAAAFRSRPTHRRISSDSAWLRQTQSRASPLLLTNQGHDGSLSAIVQAKLQSKFIDSVHVSTRLTSDSNTDSSYGTFVRFHNSGELNDIFTTAHDSYQQSNSNNDDHQPAANTHITGGDQESIADDRLQAQQSAEHIAIHQQPNDDGNDNRMPLAPSQVEPAFVSTRRSRNQENIKQFVDEMRAAREDSVRRRQDAELRRQDIMNDQAVLDATVYVLERQQKQDAQDRQRIEQMQQLLEEQQIEYLKEKLAERLQQQHAPKKLESGVQSSSAISSISGNGGGGCVPPIASGLIGGRNRIKQRRKSEGVAQPDAVVKESGRRRATMFGMFCVPNEDAASSDPIASPLPARLVRKDGARNASQPDKDKDLPPLPITHRQNGIPHTTAMAVEQDQRLEQVVPDKGMNGPLRRSRSFSHFGSSERIANLDDSRARGVTNDPWLHRTNQVFDKHDALSMTFKQSEAVVADDANSSRLEEVAVATDATDAVKERRMFRGGALRGVLGMFGGSSNSSRKSNGHHDDMLTKNQRSRDSRAGNLRNMVLYRGQRRHTLGVPEAEPENGAASLPAQRPTDADKPAPNVHVHVPKESLSNEIYSGFVQSASDDAQSSSRRRMYSHILTTLQGSDAEPLVLEPAPVRNLNLRSDTNDIADDRLQVPSGDRQSGSNGWRDSAITGVLTQVSAGVSPKHKSEVAVETAVVPTEQEFAGEDDLSQSNEDNNQPRRFKHVVRFEETAGPKARTSSLALDTITARTESSELYKQRKSHIGKSMARSTPHSHSASQVVSSDGSFTDMVASTNADAYRFHLADLPGLEGFDTPSTNDAMVSPGLSTPRHLPASERLRRLENEIFHSGKQYHPETAGSDRVDMPFDSPVSEAGTGRTQILDFAEAHTQAEMGAGLGSKYKRPSARPEIRDVRGIVWGETNPTTTAAESVEVPGAGAGLASDVGLFAGSPAEKRSETSKATLGNGTTETLHTLDISKNQYVSDEADDGQHQPNDPVLLARLVQTSPDPRKLIYDASSQFGTMRSPRSLGITAPAANGVSEASEKRHRVLLTDIAARIAKHN